MSLLLSRHASLLLAGVAVVGGITVLLGGSSAMPAASTTSAATPGSDRIATGRTDRQPAQSAKQSTAAAASTLSPAAAAWLTSLAHRTTDSSAASNLFPPHTWYVAPPPPPPQVLEAPAAPTAPPLPYTFVGSYAPQGADAVYFLVRDDRVYDAKPGDTLDGTYSFDSVANGELVFTYKPLNTRQTLAIGGSP